MRGPELIAHVEKLMDKYGKDIEFFLHGPDGLIAQSGFGPEINWCVAKIELDSDEKPSEVIKAVFCYGLPLNLKGGPLQYPIKTQDIPIHMERQAPLGHAG